MTGKPNPEIVRYIEKHLKKGFKISHIKRKLAEVGHPIEAIEDAASFVLETWPRSKKPKSFMIVYGLILIILLAVFAGFIWYKASQQIEYKGVVKEAKKNKSYASMTDVQLMNLAQSSGDNVICGFIRSEHLSFSCLAGEWESDECVYARFAGTGDECHMKRALGEGSIADCYNISDKAKRTMCLSSLFSKATSSNDKSLCQENEPCLRAFFKEHPDEEYCTNVAINRDECLIELSAAKKDVAICNKISANETNFKMHCMRENLESIEELIPFCEVNYDLYRDFDANQTDTAEEKKAFCYISGLNFFKRSKGYDCERLTTFINSNVQVSKHLPRMRFIIAGSEKGDFAGCDFT